MTHRHEPEDRRQEERRDEDTPAAIERKILGEWGKPLLICLVSLILWFAVQQFVRLPESAAASVNGRIKDCEVANATQWQKIGDNASRLSSVEAQVAAIRASEADQKDLLKQILSNVIARNNRGG